MIVANIKKIILSIRKTDSVTWLVISSVLTVFILFNLSVFYDDFLNSYGETRIPRETWFVLFGIHRNILLFILLYILLFYGLVKLLSKKISLSLAVIIVLLILNIPLFLIILDYVEICYFPVRGWI
jgi:hypothetical protein